MDTIIGWDNKAYRVEISGVPYFFMIQFLYHIFEKGKVMRLERIFFQRMYRINNLYQEYKIKYGKSHIIGILPEPIKDLSAEQIAYTDNVELMDCIVNGENVTLYYNEKLFRSSDEYIKAVLFHEFTHISDAYNFVGYENSNILMSAYSEFNAMKIEILLKNQNRVPMLDDKICEENGMTTPKKEIESYLDSILKIIKLTKSHPDKIKEIEERVLEYYIKWHSYLFAYLSFYEKTQELYFESCFKKMNKYRHEAVAKKLYKDVQNLGYIKSNPEELINDVSNLYSLCFK